jgi:hypothetical protein
MLITDKAWAITLFMAIATLAAVIMFISSMLLALALLDRFTTRETEKIE